MCANEDINMENRFFGNQALKSCWLTSCFILLPAIASAQQCQTLIWSDEFEGTSLNLNNWEVQTGDGCDQGAGMCGWGNGELQYYQQENAVVADGQLTITAKKERVKKSQYTSARLRTAKMPDSGEWTFGRFEARMKIPDGQGMWPAFWMLPTEPSVGWPTSGEIDIFESTGQQSMFAFGTIHYGQPWPDNLHSGGGILKQPDKWSDGFHTFAIEWEESQIRWYVDNLLFSTKTVSDTLPEVWPFDSANKFHLLLNLAVGGSWGGVVDNASLPQTLTVDYVRVYAGNQPSVSGEHLVTPGVTETYNLINGSAINWTVTGGTILSSSTSTVDVHWETSSAASHQILTANTSDCSISTPVYVGPDLLTETVLDDFNGSSTMQLISASGVYAVSNGILEYTRDAESQWDVIAESTSMINDANDFVTGSKVFTMDINNTNQSLVDKEILIQLENRSVATADNFPEGRHSNFRAVIEHANGWQSLRFKMAERIDLSTADNAVDSIIFLIDPGAFTSDTYTIDNIEILGLSGSENQPPVASFSFNCQALSCSFDASNSVDIDGQIVSFDWNFGDANTASGVNVNHNFNSAGSYPVELTVTDNQESSHVSTQVVTVTAANSSPTSLVVSSVIVATEGAGKGSKYGKATVSVVDDLAVPVEGAIVNGYFSGTWNESATGTTDASGVLTLLTTTSANGNVDVNFCVTDVIGALPLDQTASVNICP